MRPIKWTAPDVFRLLFFLGVGTCLYAQPTATATPRFEVAAVKPCASNAGPGRSERKADGFKSSPDRLHLPCQTLMSLIQWAYVNFANDRFNPLGSVPISGGPPWIRADLFTIDAKAERPEPRGTMNGPMLRALLEQRFKLKIHTESKEMPVYALTVAKSGAKLQVSKRDCVVLDPEHPPPPIQPDKPFPTICGMGRLNGQGWEAFAVMMGQFARLLSDYADRKVVDRTGLSGTYDIHFNLSPEDLGVSPDAAPNDGPAVGPADVFARVRASVHKIGLRLEPSRAREDMLMIDAAETPCGN
jgi:uncharacterized protein (TIGR03435 family)